MAFWTYTTPALQALGWVSTILSDWDSDDVGHLRRPRRRQRRIPRLGRLVCCPNTPGYDWTANFDNDVDGCEDSTEDTDLDNDGVELTTIDARKNPASTWVSTPDNDFDRDDVRTQ